MIAIYLIYSKIIPIWKSFFFLIYFFQIIIQMFIFISIMVILLKYTNLIKMLIFCYHSLTLILLYSWYFVIFVRLYKIWIKIVYRVRIGPVKILLMATWPRKLGTQRFLSRIGNFPFGIGEKKYNKYFNFYIQYAKYYLLNGFIRI